MTTQGKINTNTKWLHKAKLIQIQNWLHKAKLIQILKRKYIAQNNQRHFSV